MIEAGEGLAQDRALSLVSKGVLQYPSIGHGALSLWSGLRGVVRTRGGIFVCHPNFEEPKKFVIDANYLVARRAELPLKCSGDYRANVLEGTSEAGFWRRVRDNWLVHRSPFRLWAGLRENGAANHPIRGASFHCHNCNRNSATAQ